MNPEVQKALLAMVQEAKQIASAEIPLVLRDLLIQGVVENIVLLLIGLSLIPLLFTLRRYMKTVGQLRDTFDTDKGFKQFVAGIGIGITGLATLLLIGGSVSTLLTIWLAPRAYLLGLLK